MEEEVAMVAVGHVSSTLKELTITSAKATPPNFQKEMQRLPPKKLMECMLGDNIRISLVLTTRFPLLSLFFAF